MRLCLVPLFPYFVFHDNVIAAITVFLISGVMDMVDGYIARRFDMITKIGKVYDPFVDKLMQLTVLVSLTAAKWIPVFAVIIIIAKELAMIITGAVLYHKNIVVYSTWYGKAGTVVFYAIIFSMIIFRDIMPEAVKYALLWFLVAVMIAAAIGYLIKFTKIAKRENENRETNAREIHSA